MFGRSQEELRQIGRDGIVDYADTRFLEAFEERKQKGQYFEKNILIYAKTGRNFLPRYLPASLKIKTAIRKQSLSSVTLPNARKSRRRYASSMQSWKSVSDSAQVSSPK